MIYKAIKNVDFLGSHFHFYSGHKRKKQTVLGGTFTLIIIFFFIILCYIFGYNFITKNNPLVTISIENTFSYEILDTKKDSVFFAFRIEDYDGNFVNISDKLYIKIYYYSSEQNQNGEYRTKIKDEFLSYHICNDSDFSNNYNLSKNYGILFCPDFGGKKFGGYWDSPNLYYFEIQVFFCENGEQVSNNSKCTPLNELKEFLNQDNPKFFALYYQIVQFNPLSIQKPLMKLYKNFYYILSYNLQRNDDIFLKKTIVNDDQGWIFSNIKNISSWGVDLIRSTYAFFSDNDLNHQGSSSKIYEANLYTIMEKNYYTRNYTKIQIIIAEIGSFINILIIFFGAITKYFGENIRKLDTILNLFNFEEKKIMINNTLIKKSKTNIIKNLNYNDLKNKNNTKTKNLKVLDKNNLLLNFNQSEISLKENNPKNFKSSLFKVTTIDNNITNNHFLYKNEIKKSHIPQKNQERISIEHSGINLLQRVNTQPIISSNYKTCKSFHIQNKKTLYFKKENLRVCFNLFCCLTNFKFKNMNLLHWYYVNLIDANRYIRIVKEIDFIKKLILNKNQIQSLSFLKKINYCNYEERINLFQSSNPQSVISYFKTVFSSLNISENDKLIFENLSDDIKNKII